MSELKNLLYTWKWRGILEKEFDKLYTVSELTNLPYEEVYYEKKQKKTDLLSRKLAGLIYGKSTYSKEVAKTCIHIYIWPTKAEIKVDRAHVEIFWDSKDLCTYIWSTKAEIRVGKISQQI